MSYAVFEDYQFNPSYAYNPHHHLSPPLAHEEFFPDQPRSNPGRHHASFSQYDGSVDYHYDSQYAANTTRRLTVNYHPTTVSASAIEDNRGSYSPVSSPTSRHSDNLPSSPTSRYLPPPHQPPAYRSIYLTPQTDSQSKSPPSAPTTAPTVPIPTAPILAQAPRSNSFLGKQTSRDM